MDSIIVSLLSLQEHFQECINTQQTSERRLLNDQDYYVDRLADLKIEYQNMYLAYQSLHKCSSEVSHFKSLVSDLSKLKERYDYKLSKLEQKIFKTESYIGSTKDGLEKFTYYRAQVELIKDNIQNYIGGDIPMTETSQQVDAHNFLSGIFKYQKLVDDRNVTSRYKMSYEVEGSVLIIYFDDHNYIRTIHHKYNGSIIAERIENMGTFGYDGGDNRNKITFAVLRKETYEYLSACLQAVGSIQELMSVDSSITTLEIRCFKQSYLTNEYYRRYWIDENNIISYNIVRAMQNNPSISQIIHNSIEENYNVEYDASRITFIVKPKKYL